MFQLFNYSTLSTRLEKSTRTLFITLNRPDKNNCIHPEMLFELESLLAWCTSRVEISSICFDSCTSFFSPGVDTNLLPNMSAQQLEKIQQRLHKITFAMMQLPQVVFFDLGQGAANWALELAMGADVRLSTTDSKMSFNHTQLGLVPASGGMGFLPLIVSPIFARQWIALGTPVPMGQAISSGFIHTAYEASTRTEILHGCLNAVHQQAPVQRIQAKLGIFESRREAFERAIESDKKIARAALIPEDWKNPKPTPESLQTTFMPAKSMSYSVKLSLVKTDDTTHMTEH